MKKTLGAILLLLGVASMLHGEPRKEVSATVTNGTLFYTNEVDYVYGYLRQIIVKYDSSVTETITVDVVKGNSTNNYRTRAITNATTWIWLPDAPASMGEEGDVWQVTATSAGATVPANIWIQFQDEQ